MNTSEINVKIGSLGKERERIFQKTNGNFRSEKYDNQIKLSLHGFNSRMGMRK